MLFTKKQLRTQLKVHLALASPRDLVAYTRGKTEFIIKVTE